MKNISRSVIEVPNSITYREEFLVEQRVRIEVYNQLFELQSIFTWAWILRPEGHCRCRT